MDNCKWQGHALLGRKAFEALPAWEKALVKPDMAAGSPGMACLPEGVATPGDKMAAMCLILDFVYHDEFSRYARLPDGRWIPHSPPDAELSSSVGSGRPISNAATARIIETLMGNMVEAVVKDDWEEAIRHGGALAHFVQEPFTPGHAVDNNIFHELFPDPDPGRHMRLHHKFDCASGAFDPLPPRLMGTTVPEAAFRLLVEIQRGIKAGKKLIMPLVMCAYRGGSDAERKALLAEQSRQAAFVTACAWHTAICIAERRFEQSEVDSLTTLGLTSMLPYFWHACDYTEMLPGCLVCHERKIPIHVNMRGEDGVVAERLVGDGFGMGGHMGAKFFVDGDVYPRFSCLVGLPSRHTEGQDEHTDTTFTVEVDTQENTVYSEDIEYKARRLFSAKLVPGGSALAVDVDITGARSLLLCARCRPYVDGKGMPAFSMPHVAVCHPLLAKG